MVSFILQTELCVLLPYVDNLNISCNLEYVFFILVEFYTFFPYNIWKRKKSKPGLNVV